jgi:hypothetical protein
VISIQVGSSLGMICLWCMMDLVNEFKKQFLF